MTLNEYNRMLANLDPYFSYADDYSAYKAGQRAWTAASRVAESEQGVYLEAWKAYNDKVRSK